MLKKRSFIYHSILLWLILLCTSHSIYAQRSIEIHGTVSDSINLSPIDYALVYVLDQESGNHLAHTHTDSLGEYSITFQTTAKAIEINCSNLSYHKKVKPINSLHTNGVEEIDFYLIPKNKLDEVVINEKAPKIIVKGDTLEFDSDLYRDGTERNIEDVVRKLPGVNINKEGSITFRGKKVDKVLIDGDDLQGSQYTVLTKNVTAKIVDKVQVINNYVSNPLMQNIIKSDKTALNIVVAENFINDVSGRMELGSGIGENWKRNANVNFISLFKKSKSLLIGNSNNIQRDALSDAQFYMDEMSDNDLGSQRIKANAGILLNPATQSSLNIESPFLYRGNIHLGSLNHLMKFSQSLKIRISGLTASHMRAWEDQNEINFFSSGQNFSINDKNNSKNNSKNNNIQFSGDYVSFKQAFSVNLFSEFSQQGNDGDYLIRRNDVFNLQNRFSTSRKNFYHRMVFTKKTGKLAAFQFTGFYWDRNITESFYSNNPLLIDYFFSESTETTDYSQSNQQSEIIKGLLSRMIISRKHNIVAEAGFTDSKIIFEGLNCPGSETSFHNNECIIGLEQPNQKRFHFRLTDKLAIGRSELKISSAYIRKNIVDSSNDLSEGFNLFGSTLDWKYEWNYDLYSNMTFSINQDVNNYQRYYSHLYLMDNQNLIEGINNFTKRTTYLFNAKMIKVNDYKGYYLQYGLQLKRTTGDLGSISNFTNGLILNQFFQDRKSNELRTGIKVRYIIPKLKVSVDLSTGYSISTDQIKVEEEMQDILSHIFSSKIRIGTAFKHFNIHTDAAYRSNRLNYSSAINESIFNIKSLDLNMKCIVLLPKNIKMISKIKRLQLSFDEVDNNYYTLSHELLFTPTNKSYDISLEVINPLNQENYQSLINSPAFFQSSRTRAIDRFLIMTFSFGF